MRAYRVIVAALCRAHGWPQPVAEHLFAFPRRWRFDLAWPDTQLAIEIQGGLFIQGRHTRGAALLHEMEKLNAAAVAGWRVLLVTPQQLTDGTTTALLAHAFGASGRQRSTA